jgi:hypothetical protein
VDVYDPSGKVEFRTLPLFAFAAAVGALLAWLYQALTRWIPFIQLNIITVAMFGFVVGGLMTFAVHSGHCRSRFVAALFALPASLAILAASYYWAYRHMAGVIAKERPDLARDVSFPVWVAVRLETGWTVGSGSGTDYNGWVVALIWGIELLTLVGFGLVMAWRAAAEPFCEDCARWTVEKKLRLPGLSREAADGPIAAGDLSALVALEPAAEGASSLMLTAEACPNCRQRGWLSVEEVTALQKRGKTEEKKKPLLRNAALDPDLLTRFLDRAEARPAAAAPAA